MPKYDYKCSECGEVEEQYHRIYEYPEDSYCCDAPVDKVYTPAAVTFKGSGFYRTDSRVSAD